MAAVGADRAKSIDCIRRIESRENTATHIEGSDPKQAKPKDKDQYNFTDPESRIMKSADGFVQAGNLTRPRQFNTATLLTNGKVLIAGGFLTPPPSFSAWASAELYDPSTATFTATGDNTPNTHDPAN